MKKLIILFALLFVAACSSNPKVAMNDVNDKLCENHKSDFHYFQSAFDTERGRVCGGGSCVYTPSMTKNSDTMERVAGLYYLMSCDVNHGRL